MARPPPRPTARINISGAPNRVKLAPVSQAAPSFLPYGRQAIDDDDIAAVAAALRSDFLTTGPRVEAFEAAFAEAVGAPHAVACANGTAALHLAMLALDVKPGQVCIVPSTTFVATANCARFVGAEVVFADVDADSGLMTPATLADALQRAVGAGRKIAAILPVHMTGAVVDLPALAALAREDGAVLIEDACHAVGSTMDFETGPERVGDSRHSAATCFSFHPVKTIATGEGGMVTTGDPRLARRLRAARSHGLTRDPDSFAQADLAFDGGNDPNPWYYEMAEVGFNYRLPDVLCALGLSQLGKLPAFVARRRALAARYRDLLAPLAPMVRAAHEPAWSRAAPHLFVALIDFEAAGRSRRAVMADLQARGIGTQVHYIPVHRQPYYRALEPDLHLPGADAWYGRCLSLPLFPGMADDDPARVVEALKEALRL
ncbi:UDP-4-amino-4,6-dideoxy-N-acetyl-beta-L-altrosamine transaminase [Caulobacter sp. CCUG 60055]|nr:UDP-4-amino-4,6-dideoxy-N-acetyl-beta-L-altrosamine transaminase [Caulobacter sp. CCUG 60055]